LLARKRELLLESELNRQVLRLEVNAISVRARQLQSGFSWARAAWQWAAPVAGFLLARKQGKAARVLSKGSFLLSALRTGWKVWTKMREQRPDTCPEN